VFLDVDCIDAGQRAARVLTQVGEWRGERYPWESPKTDLDAAEKLVNQCGYHRRDEELADAKRAILVE
jgi:hypothetical protein